MRRRENTSFSSADSVEWKGAQVGRMALLLTLLLLKAEVCQQRCHHHHPRSVGAETWPHRLTWGSDTR